MKILAQDSGFQAVYEPNNHIEARFGVVNTLIQETVWFNNRDDCDAYFNHETNT